MKTILVRDLMAPLSEYATVSEEEAIVGVLRLSDVFRKICKVIKKVGCDTENRVERE